MLVFLCRLLESMPGGSKLMLVFLKGCLMGVCDLIPGISGGTIAFITGIYPRLIRSVKNIPFCLFFLAAKSIGFSVLKKQGKVSQVLAEVDIKFLLLLFSGVGFSIFIFSRLINFLLEDYFVYTISFFIGLILGSSNLILSEINKDEPWAWIFGLLGLILGSLFVIVVPFKPEPTYLYLFLGGFCAVSAMFLPGVSGAFVLLILGLYDFMIKVLVDLPRQLNFFFIFGLGALLGAFTASRLVSFFLTKQKNKTLFFLLGLMLGSLLVPVRSIINSVSSLDWIKIALIVIFSIFGILISIIFKMIGQNYNAYN